MAEKRKLFIYEALELRAEYSIQEMMMVVVVPALISIWQKYADSSESLK